MRRLIFAFFALMLIGGFATLAVAIHLIYQHGDDLPEYSQLADYEPPITTRMHAGDGRLLAEYAVEHRLFVPIRVIPRNVREAFLAAEDKSFYEHPGIDVNGLARAAVTNLRALGGGRRPVGGSTITQQVAKNFLLSSEVSVSRKVREAILAFRIERALDKDRIFELYLNEIYLGFGAYGVAAAAMNYFGKSLDDLTLAEAAYLAALPKAPNNYHPVTAHGAAVGRRDWVLARMLDDGRINADQAAEAMAEPLEVRGRAETEHVTAPWFAEEVRREIAQRYGERSLYRGGLSVRTSLNPRLQQIADRVLREGLVQYDRRHGYRGSIAEIDLSQPWPEQLTAIETPSGLHHREVAVVLEVGGERVRIGLDEERSGVIPFSEMRWARRWLPNQRVGNEPRQPSDVVKPGDVIVVEHASGDTYALSQIPDVDGALVALDPHTGRVLAMSGGYSDTRSHFNRATQARRQPGSAFKTFVYLAALEEGFTPSNLILDAPFVIDQGAGLGRWRPSNYSGEFYGPTTMRTGLERSRNLMTVRLADHIGMERIAEHARRFGIDDRMQPLLSMALGAGETTLLRLTTAYAMLANGGRRIQPTLIDRVQDRYGRTIFRHDQRPCLDCTGLGAGINGVPLPPDEREQIADPTAVYQVVSMLQGAVERGTGRAAHQAGVPIAGKTGTTNESIDNWFIGFTSDLVVGVFVGFDRPRTLGARETGGRNAAPIFGSFMAEALRDIPAVPFRVPPGVRLVRVSASTGLPPVPGDSNVILEAFVPGTEPTTLGAVVGDGIPDTSGEFPPPGYSSILEQGRSGPPRDGDRPPAARLRGIY